MEKLDKIFEWSFYIIGIIAVVCMFTFGPVEASPSDNITRDADYEAYCDSIWENDQDYYMDVLVTTDKYQQYVQANGEWWDE